MRVISMALLLVASVAANLALAMATRHYYTLWKQASLQPTFEHHYRSSNDAARTDISGPLLVLFGDSRIRQWSPLPQVAGFSVLNRGIDGETTAQMMHRFESDVIDLRAGVVVIQAGINDLVAAGLSSERSSVINTQVVANLKNMVHRANTEGIRVVLLTITPPASPGLLRQLFWSARIPSLVSTVNQELMRFHAPPRVYVVDTQALLQTPAGQWKPNVTADTLHLTPFGYKVLNTAVLDVLAHY